MAENTANGDQPDPSAPRADASPHAAARALVETLVRTYREQVRRALDVDLDDSPIALAFVDHHLASARDEDREPILSLLAASAGAYYGEIVRQHIGATWIGDGKDPRRLRLLLEPQFIFFSPIDQAYEAIAGTSIDPADPRVPTAPPFDPVFHLTPARAAADDDKTDDDAADGDETTDDAGWLDARLSQLPPVPEDQFHSLTCRFETLQVMLELLAAKHSGEGRAPRCLGVADYLDALG
jgi:hypothetical protein